MSAHNLIKSYLRRATKDSLLGVGCYSAAILANNSLNQVVKIGSSTDDPWVDYYYEVIQGMDTIHTPKVYRFYSDKSKYYIALMERLYPLDSQNSIFTHNVYKYISGELSYTEIHEMAEAIASVPNPDAFLAFIDYIVDRTDVINRDDCEDYPECSRTLDIHPGNWMLRKNGTLVLTDPWAHYEIESDLESWADRNIYEKYGYPA